MSASHIKPWDNTNVVDTAIVARNHVQRHSWSACMEAERLFGGIMVICVLDRDGKPLPPTMNIRKVRCMLKDGRAVIAGHAPFTIRLTYEIKNPVYQPVELCMDTGYQYVGISVKSEKHEYVSEERKLLPDEKKHHQAQKRTRRTRRVRRRYRKPLNKRAANSRHTKKEWLAPSLKHKADAMANIVKKYLAVFPLTDITLEMGQFDTQVLAAVNEGRPVPEGTDYQHGPKYGYDTLREAVFARDKHKCKICGKSSIKDGKILILHHIGYRKKDRSNRMGNLLTLCQKCHSPSAHKKGGALWNLRPGSDTLPQAAFMNSVKWYLHSMVKDLGPAVHITYGAVTKRERISRNITKSHANDAYCIGMFHPKHRAATKWYVKRRRNDRKLERFYDAKYVDSRDGKIKKAAELGCNRTKRCMPRNNPDNLRPLRGKKVSAGYRSIRKGRHSIQAGDTVYARKSVGVVKTTRFRENKKYGVYETVELKGRKGEIPVSEVKIIRRIMGWKEVSREDFYPKKKASGGSA